MRQVRGSESEIRNRRRDGVILPVVLFVLVLIGLLAAMFSFRVNADLSATQAMAMRFQTRLAAEAGLEYARMVLRTSRFDRTVWYNNPDVFNRIIVTAHGRDAKTAGTNQEFDENVVYRFSIVADDPTDDKDYARFGLTDEASKLNINTATEAQLLTLVQSAIGEKSDVHPQDIVDAILDWRDEDAEPRGEAADTEYVYYSNLPQPYRVKNGPFDSVEELLLVKGVTPEILYGEDFDRNGLLTENEKDGDRSFPNDNQDDVLNRGLYPYITVLSKENNVANDNRPRVYLAGDEATVRAELTEAFPDEPAIVDYIVQTAKTPTGDGQGGAGHGQQGQQGQQGKQGQGDGAGQQGDQGGQPGGQQGGAGLPGGQQGQGGAGGQQSGGARGGNQQGTGQPAGQTGGAGLAKPGKPNGPKKEKPPAGGASQPQTPRGQGGGQDGQPGPKGPSGPAGQQGGGKGDQPQQPQQGGQGQGAGQGSGPQQQGQGQGGQQPAGDQGQQGGEQGPKTDEGGGEGAEGDQGGEGGGQQGDNPPITSPASLMLPRTVNGQVTASPLTLDHLAVLMDKTTMVKPDQRTVPGLINVNTAPPVVLACLEGLTDDHLQKIVAKRDQLDAATLSTTAWLVTEGVMDLVTYERIAPAITARGQQFTIESVGYADYMGMVTRLQVVVDMNGPIAQTVYYRDISNLGGAYPIRETDKEKARGHH